MGNPGPVEVTDCELLSVTGEQIGVPDPEHLVHLQFRRFAGCPICNPAPRRSIRTAVT